MIGCGGKMKISSLLLTVLFLSSCGQIQRVLDGTEKLPAQIDNTNSEIKKTNKNLDATSETIRLQKLDTALSEAKDPKNRTNLVPIPFDMMIACKIAAESFTSDEVVLFMKNYILKIKKQQSADSFPAIDDDQFQYNRVADYYMIMLIAGFLPDDTVKEIVTKEADQGAYQDVMLNILKLRYDFNNSMMLKLAMLGLDPATRDAAGQYAVLDKDVKLDTLGKIEKAMEYNDKVDYICNLNFADKIDVEFEGITHEALDPRMAKANWQIILDHAQSDYKATSFSKDPSTNDKEVQGYTTRYNDLMDRLRAKISGT